MVMLTSFNDSSAEEPLPAYPPPSGEPLPAHPQLPTEEAQFQQPFKQPLQAYSPPAGEPAQFLPPFGQPLSAYPPPAGEPMQFQQPFGSPLQAYPPPAQAFVQPPGYQQYPVLVAPPVITPEKLLRRDIMMIVLVLFGILAVQAGVVATVVLVATFTSMDFMGIVQETAISGTSDPQAIAESLENSQLFSDSFMDLVMAAMLIASLLSLPMLLILRGRNTFTTDLVAVNQKAKPLSIFKALLLILGIGAAANLLAIAASPLLEFLGLSLTDSLEDSVSGMLLSPFGVFYVCLAGPIIEEIIFRGAILNRLSRHGVNFAIVTQALMFGLFHGILFQSFYTFFMGILLGYIALRYSLKWAMVVHIVNNSVAMGLVLLEESGIGPVIDTAFLVYLIVFIAGAAVLLIVKRKQFSFYRQQGPPVTPRPYQVAFGSPFLIIFAVIFLGVGINTFLMPLF